MDLTRVVVRPMEGSAPTRRVFAAVRHGAEGHALTAPVLDALAAAAVRETALPLPASP
jgi:hypothetical protein